MIELRWLDESFTEHTEYGLVRRKVDPVLQFRQMENPEEFGLQPPIWSDWVTVPIVYKPYGEVNE